MDEIMEKAIRMQKELCSVANTVEYRSKLHFLEGLKIR